MANTKIKTALGIASRIISWVLIAFTAGMMIFTIVTVSTVDKNRPVLFGYSFFIVRTDSMSPSEKNAHMDVHFNAGDIIITKEPSDPYALKENDIIAFISTNSDSYGETITHMIRRPNYTSDGRLIGYTTFGTNTDTDDKAIVEPSYIIGTYCGKLPAVGRFFAFLKTTPGYVTCILVPFLLLILYNGANVVRLFRKYKSEQNAIMEAERAKLDEERRQNEEMLRELQALREQLAKKEAGDKHDPE